MFFGCLNVLSGMLVLSFVCFLFCSWFVMVLVIGLGVIVLMWMFFDVRCWVKLCVIVRIVFLLVV